MKPSSSLQRLLRVVSQQVLGFDRLNRASLRRERLCVGCRECDGERFEPAGGLGWVCASCDEVLDVVYQVEIERCQQARAALARFVGELA